MDITTTAGKNMDCTLAALVACFSWSNLYIDTDLTYLDAIEPYQEWRSETHTTPSGVVETIGQYRTTDAPYNPYGRVAVGYGLSFKGLDLALEVSHFSSMATNSDRGSNGISLRARWYPFR